MRVATSESGPLLRAAHAARHNCSQCGCRNEVVVYLMTNPEIGTKHAREVYTLVVSEAAHGRDPPVSRQAYDGTRLPEVNNVTLNKKPHTPQSEKGQRRPALFEENRRLPTRVMSLTCSNSTRLMK